MKDILLDQEGDIKLNEAGEITVAESPVQEVKIRLKWFAGEWVFSPDKGFPWYETAYLKNPNLELIKNKLIKEIRKVDGVIGVPDIQIQRDVKTRKAVIRFSLQTSEGTYKEEVELIG